MPRAPAISALLLIAAGGCGGGPVPDDQLIPKSDADRQALRDSWSIGRAGTVARPQSVTAAAGPAPLAYITERAADVWVTDDAGRQWGPVRVDARSVVRVAEPTGVRIGPTVVDRGPLPAGRTYTIHQGVPPDTGWRNGRQERSMGRPAQ